MIYTALDPTLSATLNAIEKLNDVRDKCKSLMDSLLNSGDEYGRNAFEEFTDAWDYLYLFDAKVTARIDDLKKRLPL